MLKDINGHPLLVGVARMFKCARVLAKLDVAPFTLKQPGNRGYDLVICDNFVLLVVRECLIVIEFDPGCRGRNEGWCL